MLTMIPDVAIETWSIAENRYRLPYSHQVDVSSLLQVFNHTATSYKYLFFQALLNILEETGFSRLVISLDEILLEMLANAWYPHTYFKLSFGLNDRIAQELERLHVHLPSTTVVSKGSKQRLKSLISQRDHSRSSLLDLVPYRLLTPFFAGELRGMRDTGRNHMIESLARERFDSTRPFYQFVKNRQSILIHPAWMLYFYDNYRLVSSFISWNWMEYMQRRNPSVPNIHMKLFPPVSRSPLVTQSKYWKTVVETVTVRCIFSGEQLTSKTLSLDHFLPWSFVAHDQLWNLIPVSRKINSSKSNNLPSLERYFNKFIDLQHLGLITYRHNPGSIAWHTIIEPYIADLHVQPEMILQKTNLASALQATIPPLYTLAASQGFHADWRWEAPT